MHMLVYNKHFIGFHVPTYKMCVLLHQYIVALRWRVTEVTYLASWQCLLCSIVINLICVIFYHHWQSTT